MSKVKRESSLPAQTKSSRTWLYGCVALLVVLLLVLCYFVDLTKLPLYKTGVLDIKTPNATKMTSTVSSTTVNVTGKPPSDGFTLSPEEESSGFWIGLALAVGSSLFIGTSFILKKLGLLSVGKKEGGVRAGAGGHKYLLEWKWWSGMLLMSAGEVMNFVAYTFAPASLVTPLGALSVIFSAVLASVFLKEGLNLLGKLGCALCVIGSTVMVLHAPKDQEIQNMDQLLEKVKGPAILTLVGVLALAAAITIIFIEPKYGQSNVVVYVFICSSLGALTVQGAKGLGVAVRETIEGRNEFTNWLTYVMIAICVINILFQLNYLNKALDTFNTAVVTPTYYVMFSSFVILVSLVLFEEFLEMTAEDVIGDLCGFLTIVGGIFLLNAFKDMDITYHNLPKAKKQGQPTEKDKEEKKLNSFNVQHDHNNVFEFDENTSIDETYGLMIDEIPKELRDTDNFKEDTEYRKDDNEYFKDRKPYYDNPGFEVEEVKIRNGLSPMIVDKSGEVTHF